MRKFLQDLNCELFSLKNSVRALVVLVIMFGMNIVAFSQTNPIPFNLESGNFIFATQTATSTTYPINMQGWNNGGIANLAVLSTAASTADAIYTASGGPGTSGLSNLGIDGFNFVSTGSSPNNVIGSIALSLNTISRTSLKVSWTAADQTNFTRQTNLTLQYRIGTSGIFTTVTSSTYTTLNSGIKSPQNFLNIALPVACENQPVVQLRWLYYESASQSGPRDGIRLDDITVTSNSAGGTINSNQVICSGTLAAPLSLSDFSGTILKWQSSSDSLFTTPNDIANTTATLSAGAIGILTSTTYYRAVVQVGSSPEVFSTTGTITVNPTSVGGNIGSNETICSGTTPSALILNGKVGNVIKWQSSLDNFATAGIDIANTTSTLTIGALTTTNYYRAEVQSGVCSVANSNVLTITVTPNTFNITSMSACDTFTWANNSTTYTTSGTYTGTTTGCLTERLTLTITPSSFSDTTVSACDTYSWASTGLAYTTTGTYFGTPVNCTTPRLILTITPSSFSDTTATACDTYTWASTGLAYTTSGTYTGTAVNCTTPRLILTITPTIIPTFTQVAPICIGDNFVLPNTSLNGILGSWAPPNINTLTTLYTFTPSSSCATIATMTVTVGGIKTWNAGWTPPGAPTSIDSVLINGNYTASTDGGTINGCTMTVDNNAIVLINNNANIVLQGKLTVTSGSVTINNNSNLIQTQNIANSGDITIKRNSNALFRLDYTQWSSPVTGPKTLLQFTPQTTQASPGSPAVASRFYVYNSLTNTYNNAFNPATTTFELGKGYHLRMPNNWITAPLPAAKYTGVFTGVPNNGSQSITMSNTGAGLGFNLIGNPYPSDIQMSSFVAANSSAITGTLYFWRKTNNSLAPSYSTWTAGTFNQGTATATNPNGIISVGQGFIVEAASGQTNLTFNNTIRVADNVDHFFRAPSSTEYNRIWLNATNSLGAFCQTTVGYITGATNGNDTFDGSFFNDGDINLTSLIGFDKFAIQGRELPFDATDIVPLSFKATSAGNYNIAIDHVDGLFNGFSNIYLRDNLTGTLNNLTTGNYSFAANAGSDNYRFEVLYSLPLSNNNVTFNDNNVIVYKNNKTININSGSQTMNNVKIYDIRGRLLIEKTNISTSQIAIDSSLIGNQVLVIQITSDKNIKVSKKIVN